MALKQCKECSQEVSTKAMSCPHCGAVLKRRTGCLTWFVAIIFFLFMIGYCTSKYSYKTSDSVNKSELKNIVDNYVKSNSTTETNPIDKIKPEEVSLATLLEQYKDNEVRADELYKDKIIQTTGIVEMVKKDIINDTFVILRTERGVEIPMVQCYFDKQLASQVSQLDKGDNITVKGHLRGLFVNVLVDKCSLVRPASDNSKEDSNSRKISINSTYAQSVYERAGNIYLKDSSNNQIQLTTSGNNSNSSLSPDGRLVVFVHQTSDKPIEDSLGEKVSPTELWIVNISNKEARKIVDKNAVKKIKDVQALFSRAQFGNDSKTIFFLSSAHVTSGAVLKVDLISPKVAYLCAGNGLEVIRSGEYIGNLKINRHRYQEDGAHDCDSIVSPDGNEIKVIKESCDPPL